MSKKTKPVPITREDIERALKKFQQRGGLIKQLPDEDPPSRRLVGSRHGYYELVNEGFEIVGG